MFEKIKRKLGMKIEPRFTLSTDGVESDRGIKMEMDWNEEFIAYARARGCAGHNEQEVVYQYLVYMLRCIINVDEETGEEPPSIDKTRPNALDDNPNIRRG